MKLILIPAGLAKFSFICACCNKQNDSIISPRLYPNETETAVYDADAKEGTFICVRCSFYLARKDPVFMQRYTNNS